MQRLPVEETHPNKMAGTISNMSLGEDAVGGSQQDGGRGEPRMGCGDQLSDSVNHGASPLSPFPRLGVKVLTSGS